MRVKVGNEWFEAQPEQPIAVELTDEDKANLAGMPPHTHRYGLFDEQDVENVPEFYRRAWMAG